MLNAQAGPCGNPCMLPSFTRRCLPACPPAAAVDDDADYFSPGEDQVSTTPLRLLQAIDLYLARLQGGRTTAGPAGAGRQPAALMGGGQGLSLAQLEAVLWELREDVEGAWAGSDGETC